MATSAVQMTDINSSLAASSSNQVTNATYHKQLLTRAKYSEYYGKWADVVNLPEKGGRTILMRRYAHLAMALSPLTEGQPPAGKVPTLTDYSATLSQNGDFIAMTDMLLMTAIEDAQMHWVGLLGEQGGYTIDAVDRDVVTAATTIIYSNGTQTTDINTIIDGNDLDRALRGLQMNGAETILGGNSGSDIQGSVPTLPAYPCVIHPRVLFDLQNISGFTSAEKYKGAAPGEVGRYKGGLAFFLAPDVSALGAGAKVTAAAGASVPTGIYSVGGSSTDVYSSMIFAKHGFTRVPISAGSMKMYRKPVGSAGSVDPIDQVGTIGWKFTGSRLITNQNWLTVIKSGASA